MSAESRPIAAPAFAEALKSLTLPSLYAKASELRNAIAHLHRSNDELARYIAETAPDTDCEDAIRENEEVVRRMEERIGLLREEVEGRGSKWGADVVVNGEGEEEHGQRGNGGGNVVMGDPGEVGGGNPPASNGDNGSTPGAQSTNAQNGTAGQRSEDDDGVYL
ncbi:hypothetical protein FQN53_007356 [Emmonsiellopsis sp. PD_33]|nr:hypothetical protein FQN53_007356 [Emmonsiellopsis sp. PD_33]